MRGYIIGCMEVGGGLGFVRCGDRFGPPTNADIAAKPNDAKSQVCAEDGTTIIETHSGQDEGLMLRIWGSSACEFCECIRFSLCATATYDVEDAFKSSRIRDSFLSEGFIQLGPFHPIFQHSLALKSHDQSQLRISSVCPVKTFRSSRCFTRFRIVICYREQSLSTQCKRRQSFLRWPFLFARPICCTEPYLISECIQPSFILLNQDSNFSTIVRLERQILAAMKSSAPLRKGYQYNFATNKRDPKQVRYDVYHLQVSFQGQTGRKCLRRKCILSSCMAPITDEAFHDIGMNTDRGIVQPVTIHVVEWCPRSSEELKYTGLPRVSNSLSILGT